jgi:hypothetical protein
MRATLLVALILLVSPAAGAEDRPWAARSAIRVGEKEFTRAAVGRRMVELYGSGMIGIHVAHLQLRAQLERKEITIPDEAIEEQRTRFVDSLTKVGLTLKDYRHRMRIGVATQEKAIWNFAASKALAAEVGIVEQEIPAYLNINQPLHPVDRIEQRDDPTFIRVGRKKQAIPVEVLVRELLPLLGAPERKRLVDRLMTEAVVNDAVRSVPATSAEVLDRLIAERRERIRKASSGRVDLETFLSRQGRTLANLRRTLDRQERLRSAIIGQRDVTDDQLRAHFGRWKDFFAGKLVRARHIFFRPAAPGGPEEWKAALDRAAAVRKQLVEGASFADMALRHSDDTLTRLKQGNLGYFPRKSPAMDDAFASIAFTLEPGRLSKPVQTSQGYHLLEVTGVKDGEEVSFESVRERVRSDFADSRAVAWVSEKKRGLPVKVLWDEFRVEEGGK